MANDPRGLAHHRRAGGNPPIPVRENSPGDAVGVFPARDELGLVDNRGTFRKHTASDAPSGGRVNVAASVVKTAAAAAQVRGHTHAPAVRTGAGDVIALPGTGPSPRPVARAQRPLPGNTVRRV